MKKGLFITLEGIEGAGKSTVVDFIEDFLTKEGHDVIKTREPGGTVIGEQIREILLKNENSTLTYDTELLLVFSARAQHIQEVILPTLSSGKIILCDRFTDASYAYQGGGRGIDESRINLLEKWVQGDLRPNLTLLFDLDVSIGMQRTKKRSGTDRFEREEINFFEKVRNTYLERAKKEPQRFRIINAASSLENVKEQIVTILKDFLC
jgi:dTMP kinase